MIARFLPALLLLAASGATAAEPAGLHEALAGLADAGKFSGAVVVRDSDGVQFSRAYGLADPFAKRPFTADTPVDSGSLAKPVTAAAVLALAADGRIDLDAPVRRYVAEFPYPAISVRQLLSHSAGLSLPETQANLAGKANLDLIKSVRGRPLLFPAGARFSYCNLCTITLAELAERVSGQGYLDLARTRLALPKGVNLRPAKLSDWKGRAIGYRRTASGRIERFDSWEGERFYGAANLSVTASQLAEWGAAWWQLPLSGLNSWASADATIGGYRSGLTLGNWYCAAGKQQCHYLGHHEGFHHLLYRDSARRLSIAMVSNNTLSPALIPRLQRAIVAFAEGRADDGKPELGQPLAGTAPRAGSYRFANGQEADVLVGKERLSLRWQGVTYPAYAVHPVIRYVPGLDAYLVGIGPKSLRIVMLYEDLAGRRP